MPHKLENKPKYESDKLQFIVTRQECRHIFKYSYSKVQTF